MVLEGSVDEDDDQSYVPPVEDLFGETVEVDDGRGEREASESRLEVPLDDDEEGLSDASQLSPLPVTQDIGPEESSLSEEGEEDDKPATTQDTFGVRSSSPESPLLDLAAHRLAQRLAPAAEAIGKSFLISTTQDMERSGMRDGFPRAQHCALGK